MCGIAGIHFFNSKKTSLKSHETEEIVNKLLLGIESRGQDATGFATIRGNGDIWVEKAELEATEFVKYRTGLDKRIKSILLHTRFATKGHQSNNLNNHPVINENAVIIHNGHIRNDDDLFNEDDKLVRTAKVDSEAIAALINKYGIEKCNLALQELEGGFAVAAIDQRIPTALVLAKGKSSPLAYYKTDHFIAWASESRVLIDAFKAVKPDLNLNIIDIDFLLEGDIIYIDHGKMEKLEFKVKDGVPYNYGRHTTTPPAAHYGGTGYNPNAGRYTGTIYDPVKNNSSRWDDDEDEKTEVKGHRFKVNVDGREISYSTCFQCGIACNEDYLRKFDGGFWCDPCFQKEVDWINSSERTEEMDEEDKILEEFENGNFKEFEIDHVAICTKIGKKYGLPFSMVDFMLWDCPELLDRKVENIVITKLYDALSDAYDHEIGLLVGDYEDDDEVEEAKGTEIVKFKGNEQEFIGL